MPDQPSATAPVDPAVGAQVHIAFLGDSLTAGLGLLAQQAYPQVVEDMLEDEGYHVEPVNAGMSGDTTAGGLRRVEPLLDRLHQDSGGRARRQRRAARPDDAADARQPGADHRHRAREGRVRAAVRHGGADESRRRLPRRRSASVYVNLLREYQGRISFVPFLLEGVAGNPALNQADGIHPTAEGAKIIAQTLYPKLRDLVDRIG